MGPILTNIVDNLEKNDYAMSDMVLVLGSGTTALNPWKP